MMEGNPSFHAKAPSYEQVEKEIVRSHDEASSIRSMILGSVRLLDVSMSPRVSRSYPCFSSRQLYF